MPFLSLLFLLFFLTAIPVHANEAVLRTTVTIIEPGTPQELSVVPENHPPVAVIREQNWTRYMKVNLTGEDSYDPDGDSLDFLWTYELGAFETKKNPSYYYYTVPGEKWIALTVTDEHGLSSSAEYIFNAQEEVVSGGGYGSSAETLHFSAPRYSYPDYSLISEFMPNPKGSDTGNEWIELCNNTDGHADIGDWYLDDDEGNSKPYRIETGTVINKGACMVFSGPELNLSLKNSEDKVRLLDPAKNPKQVVEYSGCKEGYAYARREDGIFEWVSETTSGGKNNTFAPPPISYFPDDVIIKSALPNPEGADKGNELIILQNNLSETLDLSWWSLENKKGRKADLKGITAEAGGMVELDPLQIGISLVNNSDSLALFDPAGNEISSMEWDDAPSGQRIINEALYTNDMEVYAAYVIDGDTFVSVWDGIKINVRLLGIDTPETVHPEKAVERFGKESSEYLRKLIEGKTVRLRFESRKTDMYNRILAYAYLDDLFVNAEMVKKGYAYTYRRFPFIYMDEFIGYEEQAKAARLGMWAIPRAYHAILNSPNVIPASSDVILNPHCHPELDSGSQEVMQIPDQVRNDIVGLKIETILPNSEKGKSVEYIRLMNTRGKKIDLKGWKLDDDPEGGSKPFELKGGAIHAGAKRTFRKNETEIALNNKDDCAVLINPLGNIVDRICYGNTHKSELFTHAGGNWEPKRKQKKAVVTVKKDTPAPKTSSRPAAITKEEEMKKDQLIELKDNTAKESAPGKKKLPIEAKYFMGLLVILGIAIMLKKFAFKR